MKGSPLLVAAHVDIHLLSYLAMVADDGSFVVCFVREAQPKIIKGHRS
jgi:hypothetical protein